MASQKQQSGVRGLLWMLLRWGVTLGAIWYVVTQITWNDRLLIEGRTVAGWQRVSDEKREFVSTEGRVYAIPVDADQPDAVIRFIPGIVAIFARIKWGYFILAAVLLIFSIGLGGVRWRWLLQAHDLDPGLREAVRLTWMGFLSNNVLPGATGGDLVKAVCIARRTPGKRTSAVMTVLLDRVIGMVALMMTGAVGIFAKILLEGWPGLDSTGKLVLMMLSGVVVAGMLFFSRRVRDIFRIAAVLDRIPLGGSIKKIDDSLFHYRHHKFQLAKCVGLGMFIWFLTVTCMYCLGRSISMTVDYLDYYVCLPAIFTLGALVPSIAGLGVLEGLFQHFFGLMGAPASLAVALSLLYRLTQLVSSIPGAWPLYREFSLGAPPVVASLADDAESGNPEPA